MGGLGGGKRVEAEDVARLVQTTPRTVARWRRAYGLPGRRAAQTSYAKPLSYLELITIAFIAAFRRTGVELDDLRQVHEILRGVFNLMFRLREGTGMQPLTARWAGQSREGRGGAAC